MATLPSFGMATRPPLGSRASCILIVAGCCHGQPAHCEVCATMFTTKWTPQYRRPQTKTEIRLNIRCPLEMSRGHRICYRICTYNYMQYTGGAYRSRAHFPSHTSLDQGCYPLMFSQRAPGTGGTLVFGVRLTLRFTDQLQNWRAPERRHARRSDCTFVMEGKHNLCLVGCCSLPA